MITRQRGGPLEPLDLEIEATARRNKGRNHREQVRRRLEFEEMAEDNLVDPEIERGVNGQENEEMEWGGQERGMHEVQNVQGGHLQPPHAQGGGGPQQGGQNQGPYWNAQGYYPQPPYPKHENFSYSNPKAAVQYPPGFDPGAKPPNNEGRPSTDEMLSLIYKEMKEKDAKVDEYMNSNNNQMKNMEFQIGQLATTVGNMQNEGKFPSTTEPNPKEHCKAIELRSGTRYQGPSLPSEDNVEEKAPEIEQEAEDDKVSEKEEDEEIAPLSEDEEEKGKMSEK
ncbi:hypothetical protein ACS0TY_033311 [Phlomoides rotata]